MARNSVERILVILLWVKSFTVRYTVVINSSTCFVFHHTMIKLCAAALEYCHTPFLPLSTNFWWWDEKQKRNHVNQKNDVEWEARYLIPILAQDFPKLFVLQVLHYLTESWVGWWLWWWLYKIIVYIIEPCQLQRYCCLPQNEIRNQKRFTLAIRTLWCLAQFRVGYSIHCYQLSLNHTTLDITSRDSSLLWGACGGSWWCHLLNC